MSNQLTNPDDLNAFAITGKADLIAFSKNIVENLEDGQGVALKVLKQIKAMSTIITTLTSQNEKDNKHHDLAKRFIFLAQNEHRKYGSKSVDLFGAKFEAKEAGVQYDYSKCGDPVWLELEEQLKVLKADKTAREAILKAMPVEGIPVRFDDEEIRLYPPTKTSTSTIAVTIK